MRPAFGDWRSLVAHFVRDEGVGGSNPLSPTKFEKPAQRAGFFAFEAHEDENLRGRGGSTRAKRENVAPATARRASEASHPARATNFKDWFRVEIFQVTPIWVVSSVGRAVDF